jgi:organic hydroperoxide reductase OsmC/OhrA
MKYFATVSWEKAPDEFFVDGKYSRVHQWKFDGGMEFNASASPHNVPAPFADPAFVDPEEAFIASIASCHMLFFLWYCAKQKYAVLSYKDNADGIMGKGEDGKEQMLSVTLHPMVRFDGKAPGPAELAHLHELSHESCYIANSVKTRITIGQ